MTQKSGRYFSANVRLVFTILVVLLIPMRVGVMLVEIVFAPMYFVFENFDYIAASLFIGWLVVYVLPQVNHDESDNHQG